jgi:cytokinin riboside 5'-monophosphate phosphoribohydrolase
MKKRICVYCSSSNAIGKRYFEESGKLALKLAETYDLVYGAGDVGLMGHVARTFKNAGSHVTGVIPEKLHGKGITFGGVDELVVTKTMSERKMDMMERSDAFISLPGGFGTLEEILEILTLKQLGYHDKPVVFFNPFGFYDPLMREFDLIYGEKFAKEVYREFYLVSDSPEEISKYLADYRRSPAVDKWT